MSGLEPAADPEMHAVRLLLDRLGVTPEQLFGQAPRPTVVPTFDEYIARVVNPGRVESGRARLYLSDATFDELADVGDSVADAARAAAPGLSVATVAWFGYRPPMGIGALGTRRSREGGRALPQDPISGSNPIRIRSRDRRDPAARPGFLVRYQ